MLTKNGTLLSHLFFADDLILFCQAKVGQTEVIADILDRFCMASGHKVNASKTHIYFSPSTRSEVASAISNRLGFSKVDDLGLYLGLPLFHERVTNATFQFLIDKVRSKLSGWNANSLSLAGRITLAKSVVAAIPNYIMQTAMLLVSIIKKIDKLIRRFIWGTKDGDSKTSLVKWKYVCQPLNNGGLGFRRLKDHNKMFFSKLGFRILANRNDLWVRILREKYHVGDIIPDSVIKGSASFFWRSLAKIWDDLRPDIYPTIGDGKETSFWYANWIPKLGPLV